MDTFGAFKEVSRLPFSDTAATLNLTLRGRVRWGAESEGNGADAENPEADPIDPEGLEGPIPEPVNVHPRPIDTSFLSLFITLSKLQLDENADVSCAALDYLSRPQLTKGGDTQWPCPHLWDIFLPMEDYPEETLPRVKESLLRFFRARVEARARGEIFREPKIRDRQSYLSLESDQEDSDWLDRGYEDEPDVEHRDASQLGLSECDAAAAPLEGSPERVAPSALPS